MEVLLGTPPPPPPPNVPALKENERERQSVVGARTDGGASQECRLRACHKMMDPIGFSLENFDAVGAWRTKDSGFPIDASGKMFDGTKLDGPVSLRQAILSHSDAFLGTFTENLLAYGLGRVVDYRDMPAVRVDRAGGGAQTTIVSRRSFWELCKSAPFQMRQGGQMSRVPRLASRDEVEEEENRNVHH